MQYCQRGSPPQWPACHLSMRAPSKPKLPRFNACCAGSQRQLLKKIELVAFNSTQEPVHDQGSNVTTVGEGGSRPSRSSGFPSEGQLDPVGSRLHEKPDNY